MLLWQFFYVLSTEKLLQRKSRMWWTWSIIISKSWKGFHAESVLLFEICSHKHYKLSEGGKNPKVQTDTHTKKLNENCRLDEENCEQRVRSDKDDDVERKRDREKNVEYYISIIIIILYHYYCCMDRATWNLLNVLYPLNYSLDVFAIYIILYIMKGRGRRNGKSRGWEISAVKTETIIRAEWKARKGLLEMSAFKWTAEIRQCFKFKMCF